MYLESVTHSLDRSGSGPVDSTVNDKSPSKKSTSHRDVRRIDFHVMNQRSTSNCHTRFSTLVGPLSGGWDDEHSSQIFTASLGI